MHDQNGPLVLATVRPVPAPKGLPPHELRNRGRPLLPLLAQKCRDVRKRTKARIALLNHDCEFGKAFGDPEWRPILLPDGGPGRTRPSLIPAIPPPNIRNSPVFSRIQNCHGATAPKVPASITAASHMRSVGFLPPIPTRARPAMSRPKPIAKARIITAMPALSPQARPSRTAGPRARSAAQNARKQA